MRSRDVRHIVLFVVSIICCVGAHADDVGQSNALCEPDPAQKLCRNIPEHSLKRAEHLHIEQNKILRALEAALDKRLTPLIEEWRVKHGKYPSKDEEKILLAKAHKKARSEFEKIIQKKKGKAFIEKLLKAFITTLKSSLVLSKNEVTTLQNVIQKCSNNVKIDRYSQFIERKTRLLGDGHYSFTRNGFFEVGDATDFEDRISELKRKRVNVVNEGFPACGLRLSLKTWQDCADENAMCAETVLHEMGHMIQSCGFYKIAYQAEKQALKAELAYGNSDTLASRRSFFSAQTKAAKILAELIVDSAECLRKISSPNDSIPNACKKKVVSGSIEEMMRSRCDLDPIGFGGFNSHQSQWNEAEADFWGASALAIYLTKTHHSPNDRQSAFADVITQFCADIKLETRIASQRDPLFAASAQDPLQASAATVSLAFDESDCTLNPNPKIWAKYQKQKNKSSPNAGKYQSLGIRLNRNYLRNSDLREAIGCSLSEKVPVACSPRGIIHKFLIEQ